MRIIQATIKEQEWRFSKLLLFQRLLLIRELDPDLHVGREAGEHPGNHIGNHHRRHLGGAADFHKGLNWTGLKTPQFSIYVGVPTPRIIIYVGVATTRVNILLTNVSRRISKRRKRGIETERGEEKEGTEKKGPQV